MSHTTNTGVMVGNGLGGCPTDGVGGDQ